MLNHIAVVLRGHVRTFRVIYPHIFEFYKKIAKNVDYYFITWQGSQVNTCCPEIFKNENLIAEIHLENSKDFGVDSYKSSSFLNYMILPYKHQREKHVQYDIVFDTRPDVIPIFLADKPEFDPDPNTLYTTSYDLHNNFRYNYYDVAIQDWFMAMSSKVFDQMAERFIILNDQGVQITIRTYAQDNNIHVCTMPFQGYMVRPNIYECIKDDKLTIDEIDFNQKISEWISTPREKKLELIDKLLIMHGDYETGSMTCSI